jgi:hypothetical protein
MGMGSPYFQPALQGNGMPAYPQEAIPGPVMYDGAGNLVPAPVFPVNPVPAMYNGFGAVVAPPGAFPGANPAPVLYDEHGNPVFPAAYQDPSLYENVMAENPPVEHPVKEEKKGFFDKIGAALKGVLDAPGKIFESLTDPKTLLMIGAGIAISVLFPPAAPFVAAAGITMAGLGVLQGASAMASAWQNDDLDGIREGSSIVTANGLGLALGMKGLKSSTIKTLRAQGRKRIKVKGLNGKVQNVKVDDLSYWQALRLQPKVMKYGFEQFKKDYAKASGTPLQKLMEVSRKNMQGVPAKHRPQRKMTKLRRFKVTTGLMITGGKLLTDLQASGMGGALRAAFTTGKGATRFGNVANVLTNSEYAPLTRRIFEFGAQGLEDMGYAGRVSTGLRIASEGVGLRAEVTGLVNNAKDLKTIFSPSTYAGHSFKSGAGVFTRNMLSTGLELHSNGMGVLTKTSLIKSFIKKDPQLGQRLAQQQEINAAIREVSGLYHELRPFRYPAGHAKAGEVIRYESGPKKGMPVAKEDLPSFEPNGQIAKDLYHPFGHKLPKNAHADMLFDPRPGATYGQLLPDTFKGKWIDDAGNAVAPGTANAHQPIPMLTRDTVRFNPVTKQRLNFDEMNKKILPDGSLVDPATAANTRYYPGTNRPAPNTEWGHYFDKLGNAANKGDWVSPFTGRVMARADEAGYSRSSLIEPPDAANPHGRLVKPGETPSANARRIERARRPQKASDPVGTFEPSRGKLVDPLAGKSLLQQRRTILGMAEIGVRARNVYLDMAGKTESIGNVTPNLGPATKSPFGKLGGGHFNSQGNGFVKGHPGAVEGGLGFGISNGLQNKLREKYMAQALEEQAYIQQALGSAGQTAREQAYIQQALNGGVQATA